MDMVLIMQLAIRDSGRNQRVGRYYTRVGGVVENWTMSLGYLQILCKESGRSKLRSLFQNPLYSTIVTAHVRTAWIDSISDDVTPSRCNRVADPQTLSTAQVLEETGLASRSGLQRLIQRGSKYRHSSAVVYHHTTYNTRPTKQQP